MTTDDVYSAVESNRDRLFTTARDLWETPELGLHEEHSASLLIGRFQEAGFDVETGIGDMPTAFVAAAGSGDPTIGILGEYDALPDLSQEVSAERAPIEEGAPGHGCGHNLFGVAGVEAAIGLAEVLAAEDRAGTVRFYGCPAEETLVGKVFMARAGAFDDLDAAITWHPSDRTLPQRSSSLALDSVQYTFEGTPAHAAMAPESGRSALDGVELMNTGVEYIREHIPEKARIHYSITDGGSAPNVVPQEATVWYFVRAPDRTQVDRLSDWLDDIAHGAATMTRTDVNRRYITGCWDFLVNETIADLMGEQLSALGPVEYSEADREFAAELKATLADRDIDARLRDLPEHVQSAMRERAIYSEPIESSENGGLMMGSTEVGDVSWITPTAQFRTATWPVGTPAHTWQAVAANGDFGMQGALHAAKALAGTAYELLTDEATLEAAAREFERATGEEEYETPLPESAEPPFDITLE